MAFDQIVAHYIREYRHEARAEMRVFESQRTASEAIRKAALCIYSEGKRHPHQRRIPRAVLEESEAKLQAIRRSFVKAINFEEIHRLVEEEIGGIRGIGPLSVYDIAHRIGAYFRKTPRLVYLHAGARTGARAFNITGDYFDPKILPKAFSRLAPSEIEDCLCIYKDELRNEGRTSTIRRTHCIPSRRRVRCS